MSLQLRDRAATLVRRRRRLGLAALLGTSLLIVGGCGSDTAAGRLAMPEPATVEGEHTLDLWQGAWIAALVTGVIVWGLIFYAIWRYRRRSDDEVPVQTRYNLPLEIFYTVFPIIMVIVFFGHTVRVQNLVLNDPDNPPDYEITVVGQQWSWTFNYPTADGRYVYNFGTGNDIPELVLPVDETVRFNLVSPDVIHDFGVPGFLIKMDVIPGQDNYFQVTPKTTGVYDGKCYELCGVYHSRMLFTVRVVEDAEYQEFLAEREAAGAVSDEPILGNQFASTPRGTVNEADSEETEGESE